MKISKEIEDLLNEQINNEFAASHVYLTMASYFFEMELHGFGNFFVIQAQEENMHAMRYFTFLHDVGGALNLQTLPAPDKNFNSITEVFQKALHHEESVTQSIYDFTDKALKEKDFATYTFLEWFVKEQIEEELLMRSMLKRVQMIEGDNSALFFLNEELAKRKLDANLDNA